eukprot:GHVL01015037.1.p1 GENE.GHVL01015037.1~~GHVL01015037.1.p1  ORF type:complete len:432 (+),score=67.47 GHVL01015037.1:45-1340(+)
MEARLKDFPNCWFPCCLVNLDGSKCCVKFDIWGECEVPLTDLRASSDAQDFYQASDEIDVLIDDCEGLPPRWSSGVISRVTDVYYITLDSSRILTHICEAEALRRINRNFSFDSIGIEQLLVPVPKDLCSWLTSADGQGCLDQVQSKTKVLKVVPVNEGSEILLTGSPEHVRRARLVLEVHYKHQAEIQKYYARRNKTHLEESNECHCEFEVDPLTIGLIIGKKGANLKLISNKYNVDVKVLHAEPNSTSRDRVRISGEDPASVQAARVEAEIVSEPFKVDSCKVGWVIGKKGHTIEEIVNKSGILSAQIAEDSGITLVGSRRSVDDAIMLLESHLHYYPAYQDLDRQKAEANDQMQRMNITTNGSPRDDSSPGRGGGQQRGRGGRSAWNDPESDQNRPPGRGRGRGSPRLNDHSKEESRKIKSSPKEAKI